MEEIIRFVMLARSERFTVSGLCEQFGISRKTGYKYLDRYSAEGLKGLPQRSHRPLRFPQHADVSVEALIVAECRLHPAWGPRKLHFERGMKWPRKNRKTRRSQKNPLRCVVRRRTLTSGRAVFERFVVLQFVAASIMGKSKLKDEQAGAEQIAALRLMTPEQRWRAAHRLYWTMRRHKAAFIQSLHPDWPQERVAAEVREIFYHART